MSWSLQSLTRSKQHSCLSASTRTCSAFRRCLSSKSIHVSKTRRMRSASPHGTAAVHSDSATSLVDSLLVRTRELMSGSSQHVVAYSGGVDSSLVAALLQQLHDDSNSVKAVLGISSAVSDEQVELARRVAAHINVDLVEVKTTEQESSVYRANDGNACFACKTHLYSALQSVAQHYTAAYNNVEGEEAYLYNGTNKDDTNDKTRVGLLAADNYEVKSPLLYVTKQEVRRAAKWLGLPNHDTAAAPCLRSRLALGVEATRAHLETIAKAERFVRTCVPEFDHTSNLRVRMLANNQCVIEVDGELVELIAAKLDTDLTPYMQSLGFESVRVRPFKSGSVSRTQSSSSMDSFEEPMVAAG